MPTEDEHNVTGRTLDLAAEVRRLWGTEWNKPSVSYEFTDRKFYLRTEDAAIYETSPDF
jgi:hypothetical protein